ncbi:DUF6640 family protein [Dictyobacter kobayashii]|uniref:Uncharacterized protein n=1 Tax=Dictyobacter kobayashii TaxID=2014872 RepID=A0A402AS29_9CHLR|nr:DUF6640 family protein [Dictyobacter kobayashii]GCE21904.1 hypothetical protein KDK_57040 [Dictyobacter kobayashii]
MLAFFDPGRLLVSIVALATILGGLLADFVVPATARQHIFNPHWPPHAKFHNGQTISLGILLGGLSLFLLWIPLQTSWPQFQLAVLIASFYWIALLCARAFPGTAWTDPEFKSSGHALAPQFILTLILLALLVLGSILRASHL